MIFALAILACNTSDNGKDPSRNGPDDPGVDPTTPGVIDPTDPDPEVGPTCDAGDDVWVQRVFPIVVGRRPHGSAEVRMWAKAAEDHGRDNVVRALARTRDYQEWWTLQLSDWVYATRSGILGDDAICFEDPQLADHDGSLTEFLATSDPLDSDYGPNFNMADVMADSLVADDLSVFYRANLFARTDVYSYFSATAGEEEMLQRATLGDNLLETYIDRDLFCVGCHNSEYSVTDDADPALDRAWAVPGLLEKSLFANSSGPLDSADFYAMNKVNGAIRSFIFFPDIGDYTVQPWGMDANCGQFDATPTDMFGMQNAYFGGEYGGKGSVWDIEALLAEGVVALEDGRTVNPDNTVDPAETFAYLTGQHVVDKTWQLAFGNRLLLPYGMARNADQLARLQTYTDEFVEGGWSMTELLVDLTTDPYFNTGLPGTCGADAYGLDPILDPYTLDESGAVANNGPGELVRRFTARGVVRSLYLAMDWGEPTEYFGFAFQGDDELALQAAMGTFQSEVDQGFNGIDFQGLLVWEEALHSCENPSGTGPGFLKDLYGVAYDADETVGNMALALKDRIIQRSVFEDAEEEVLVETLMQLKLDDKVRDVDPAVLSENIALWCGVLTQTPDFMLTAEPMPTAAPPAITYQVEEDCDRLVEMMSQLGVETTCLY